MAILGTFRFGGDIQEVVVDGNNLFFHKEGMITTIEGLKLSKSGVAKEFPDLENQEDWRRKAIDRLKAHVKSMGTEMDKMTYVKDELTKQGYTPLFYHVAGFRPKKFKEKQ